MVEQAHRFNFKPVPPATTIAAEMGTRHLSAYKLSVRSGIPLEDIDKLRFNQLEITAEIAEKLAPALGGSPEFWLNLQTNYNERLKAVPPDAAKLKEVMLGIREQCYLLGMEAKDFPIDVIEETFPELKQKSEPA